MGGLVLIQPSLILVFLIKALKLFSCRLDDETLMRLYTKLTSCRLIQYEVESKHAFVLFKRFVHIDLIYNNYLFKDHLRAPRKKEISTPPSINKKTPYGAKG